MKEKIKEIVDRIVSIVDPDIILLFGSRASGGEREDSDLDLLVIKSNLNESRRMLRQVYSSLSGIGMPVDIIIVDRDKLNEYIDDPYMIYGQAVKEGRTLYAKA